LYRYKLIVLYIIGIFFLLLTGAILSTEIFSKEDPFSGKGGLSFPEDREVENLLFSYIDTESEKVDIEEADKIKSPTPSVLSALNPQVYRVKEGDTISEIAARHNLRMGTIISFNNIQDVRKLQVGMELRIPNIDGVLYQVKRGDALSLIAQRFDVPLNHLLDANNIKSSLIRAGQELFVPGAKISNFELKKALGELFIIPVRGEIASGFGMRNDPFTGVRRMHYGLDIAGRIGTDVVAAMDGTVATMGINPKGFGKYVILTHQGRYQTLYAHLDNWTVFRGQHVKQGEKIGELGNTGRSTGPHLHFSIYHNHSPVDPLNFLY
ncbi:MAG: M23 family peptidase, partial [Spirochaetes bacterium]